MNPGQVHYDARYFAWQRRIGEFGGRVNPFKFRDYIQPTDRVLEFGCGGGYLLANLKCQDRAGIEVNPSAIEVAKSNGILCYTNTEQVSDEWADVIISHSALEHVSRPLDELIALRRKLRRGGLIVFFVPCEAADWLYKSGDINQHLYTWSPMSLGNLFASAGFHVTRVDVIRHAWPPGSPALFRLIGEPGFRLVARLYWLVRRLLSFLYPMKIAAGLRLVAVNHGAESSEASSA
jgi:SAM-dependent methyltransferase